MRVVVQRVIEAAVRVDGRIVGSSRIGPGVPALVGFEAADRSTDLEWMARRLRRRRVFGVDMQLSSIDDRPVTIVVDSKAVE